jgi:ribokinase
MHTPASILVVGSSNTDMVIKAEKFPLPGETILGGEFFLFPGGKGANQAVAASRLGGSVAFVARVGNDIFGEQALQHFKKEGILTDYIISDSTHPSGVALITVDAHGENTIVVAQGSNGALSADDVQHASKAFEKAEIILMQLEIPLPAVMQAAKIAKQQGKKVILNPAPARSLPAELFTYLYLITPNKTETEVLTGVQLTDPNSFKKAAEIMRKKGVANVIITLGSKGAYIYNDEGGRQLAAPAVKAIDTTAAGDVFNGALAVAIAEGKGLDEAVEFANYAAAISVTKMGAQASAPYRYELNSPGR